MATEAAPTLSWREITQQLQELLRLKTQPVAARFFTSTKQRPKSLTRSRYPLNVCQYVGLARYAGRAMYFTAEDNACIVGAIALGLIDRPDSWSDGSICSFAHKDVEGALRFLDAVPRIPFGEVKAVAVAGMAQETLFEPDLVAIYGNTAQMMRLVGGLLWESGDRLAFTTGGEYSACADGLAQTYLSRQVKMALACAGDRMTGMVTDDELSFWIPAHQLDGILEGLKATHKATPYPLVPLGLDAMPTNFPRFLLTDAALSKIRQRSRR